jgi:hypothetical protein
MSLTPSLLADVLRRQGLISPEQAEEIRKESRQIPERLRSQLAADQKAFAYDLVASFRFPNAKSEGGTVGEMEIARAVADDAGLEHIRIDTLALDVEQID